MRKKSYLILVLCFLMISTVIAGCSSIPSTAKAAEETYPSHQIKLIVPFDMGSGTDMHARALQKMAAKHLKQSMLVLNKPGGGASIGLSEVARAKPDGYTWGFSVPEVIFHSVYGTSPKYHYLTALDPVAQITSLPLLLVVNAQNPWTSVQDVVQYAKDNKKPIRFAHSGLGSASHVLGEVFGQINGVETIQVPCWGGGEKTAMLLGNHIDMVYVSPGAVKEHVKAGKLRVLATTGSKRSIDPLFADIPTHKELGIDIEFNDWFGIVTPKPLPPEIKSQIAAALKEMILDPEFKAAVEMLGSEVDYLSPEECQEKWIQDAQRLKKMVTETGILEQVRLMQGNPLAKNK